MKAKRQISASSAEVLREPLAAHRRQARIRLFSLALAVVALGGCSDDVFLGDDADEAAPLVCAPEHRAVPCAKGVEEGVRYEFNLLTHCGVEWAYFDGRYWVPNPKVQTPSHWPAITEGIMVLRSQDVADFEATDGGSARFVPASDSFRPETCA